MEKYYLDCAKSCSRRGGFWKFAAVMLLFAFAASAAAAFAMKLKACSYRDAMVKMSSEIPNTPEQEAELAELRKREWSRAHAPANRKSDQDRLAENRVSEEA